MNEKGIIGSDFLEAHKATIDYKEKTVKFKINYETVTIPLISKTSRPTHIKVISTGTTIEPKKGAQMKTLPSSKQQYLDSILKEYSNVFRNEPGQIIGYECKIKLKDSLPVNQRPYPIPVAKHEAVEAEIK